MDQIVMKVIPVASGIFRDIVMLGLFISMWKIIVAKIPDFYDKILFAAVGLGLLTGDLADIGALLRYPCIGLGIVFYSIYRKKSSISQIAFLLLLLYNIHALSFLIADCLYDFLNTMLNKCVDMGNLQFLERTLYIHLAVAQTVLMLTYALLAGVFVLLLKKIAADSFEMGARDFCFLSVLNVVGIIFAYLILGFSIVKLETDVFILFDERRDALWKVPLMSALLLSGELASIYVWQRYRLLLAEKENVLIYESKLKQIKERLDEADSFYGNIRVLKHDIRNHISNIQNLYAKGDFEHAGDYIAGIDRALDEMDYKYSTGNSVCDVIINDKYRVCVRENIAFSSDFAFYDQAGVASFDMGIILSNLLDNAIEACQKIDSGDRFIRLKSKLKGSFILLEISNSYTGEIVLDSRDGLPVSTKPDSADHLNQKSTVANPSSRPKQNPIGENLTSQSNQKSTVANPASRPKQNPIGENLTSQSNRKSVEAKHNGQQNQNLVKANHTSRLNQNPAEANLANWPDRNPFQPDAAAPPRLHTEPLPEAGSMHGIGLRSSRRVAEKYLGDLKIETTADTFTVIVMLQMKCPVDTL